MILAMILTYMIFAMLLNSVGTVILQSIQGFGITKADASLLEAFKDLPIAITLGDVAGIGPEIVAKAWRQGLPAPAVVYGDAAALARAVARWAPGISVQVLGGTGVTDDTPVHQIFRDIRAFRVYDGPSEVHRWSLAKRIFKKFSL